MKCGKCGEEVAIQPGKSANFCYNCGNKIEAEKSGDWKYFDNTKDLLAFIAAEYGLDALFSKKYLSDHASPALPPGKKRLVSEAFSCGAVKILHDNMTADQQHKEIAVKQAVKKLTDLLFSQEAAECIVWEFTNAIGWGSFEPKDSSTASQQPQQAQNDIFPDTSIESNNTSVYPSVGSSIKFADIDWRVLAVENTKALIISEKILEKRPYNVEYKSITWESCTLRKYLNCELYNKFGAAKSAIAETRSINLNNPWLDTIGGNITTDKMFLLSLDELVKYFGDSGKLTNNNIGSFIYDQYNSVRIANYGNEGASWWWLRSPGSLSSYAARVRSDGSISVTGDCVYYGSGGVRPALWLNL